MAVGLKARSKYNAKSVVDDGIRFDSQAEYSRYCDLRWMVRAKQITDLRVHPVYPIVINDKQICKVELDFVYLDKDGKQHVEDVKGMDTALSRLKRKLVEAAHGITVEVVR